jgi:hypothetical protein
MQRYTSVLIVGLILGLGIAIGLGARTVLDWTANPAPETLTSAPAAGQTPALPIQAAAAPQPGAPPTSAPPTAAPAPTPTAQSRDVVVEVTESQLQTQLSGMLVGQSLGSTPLGEATVQTVNVELRDSLIRVGGGAKAGFLQAPFLAAGTVAPNGEGRPVVTVSQASVGGVDLPEGARNALADSLQTRVDDLFADRSVKIRTIVIADGKMRVVGTSGS